MKILNRTIRKARGKHCARIRYEDENGKHELLRTCDSRSEARTKLAQIEAELLEKGPLQRKNKNPDALVFEQAKVNLRNLWIAAYAKAGVPKGTRMFYSVRHALATNMANNGMELPELARLLGHSNVAMTYRYHTLTKETIDKARNILNRRAMVNGQ